MTRNVAFLFEEASVCTDGRLMQINHVSCFFKGRSGFIEADMTVKTDAEQLEVDAAEGFDECIIFSAFFGKVIGATVGNVGVLATNIDVVKEVGLHKVAVALVVASVKADVFVKVYRGYNSIPIVL